MQRHAKCRYDISLPGGLTLRGGEEAEFGTGLILSPPPGLAFLLLGRSSLSSKYRLSMKPQIIDEDFRGE